MKICVYAPCSKCMTDVNNVNACCAIAPVKRCGFRPHRGDVCNDARQMERAGGRVWEVTLLTSLGREKGTIFKCDVVLLEILRCKPYTEM